MGSYSVTPLEVHWILLPQKYKKRHTHRFMEIHVPYSGSGKLHTENTTYNFQAGQFTVTPPKLLHSWGASQSEMNMQVWWLMFSKNNNAEECFEDHLIENLLFAHNHTFSIDSFYFHAFDLIIQELGKNVVFKTNTISPTNSKNIMVYPQPRLEKRKLLETTYENWISRTF